MRTVKRVETLLDKAKKHIDKGEDPVPVYKKIVRGGKTIYSVSMDKEYGFDLFHYNTCILIVDTDGISLGKGYSASDRNAINTALEWAGKTKRVCIRNGEIQWEKDDNASKED